MQRRPIIVGATAAGAGISPEFSNGESSNINNNSRNASSSNSSSSSSALRRKKKRNLLAMKKLLSPYLQDDDGPFFVLMGALGCGLALLILAVGYRMISYLYNVKHNRHLDYTPPGPKHTAHMHLPGNKHKAHAKHGQKNKNKAKQPNSNSNHQEAKKEQAEEGRSRQRQLHPQQRRGRDDDSNKRGNDDDDTDDGGDDDNVLDPLPFEPDVYRIPEAMDTMGDRSPEYAQLRELFDTKVLPLDYDRSLEFVQQITKPIPPSFLSLGDGNSAPLPLADSVIHHSDHVSSDAANTNEEDEEEEEFNPSTHYEAYDVNNCPYEPPRNYPREWNLVHEVLEHWPAEDTNIPKTGIHQGLCQFDYRTDYDKAMHYRELELPFVVVNDPRVARTAERWNAPGYMEKMVGPTVLHRTEYNTNNHFLYHMPAPGGGGGAAGRLRRAGAFGDRRRQAAEVRDLRGRKAELQNKEAIPDALRMTFSDWLVKANVSADSAASNREHWYYRLIGCGSMGNDGSCDKGSTEALYDELPFFQPLASNGTHANPNALYLGDPDEQKGIHCRFGMKGVIAENHFDASRNAIAVFMGQRRYILSHPNQCANLALLPKQHDSARHSAVDYTNPDLHHFPEFEQARANEVILQAGQVLYLPTNWFHYIVSLNLNYQCNARSGMSDHYWPPIHDCGF